MSKWRKMDNKSRKIVFSRFKSNFQMNFNIDDNQYMDPKYYGYYTRCSYHNSCLQPRKIDSSVRKPQAKIKNTTNTQKINKMLATEPKYKGFNKYPARFDESLQLWNSLDRLTLEMIAQKSEIFKFTTSDINSLALTGSKMINLVKINGEPIFRKIRKS